MKNKTEGTRTNHAEKKDFGKKQSSFSDAKKTPGKERPQFHREKGAGPKGPRPGADGGTAPKPRGAAAGKANPAPAAGKGSGAGAPEPKPAAGRPAKGQWTGRPDAAAPAPGRKAESAGPRAEKHRSPRHEQMATGKAPSARKETGRPALSAPREQARPAEKAGNRNADRKPFLRSGETVELSILSTNDDGFGVALHDSTRVLVAGGLPGERLVARVTYVGRRETFANPIRMIESSPDRNPAPACTMGRTCDSCSLTQMRYPAQLAWKKNLVAREFRKYPSLSEVAIHDTVASPKELEYRNSAKLVVSGKYSAPLIGIYRRNSHEVMEITECSLHHPLINKVVKAVKVGIKKGKVPIYNPKSEMGLLRYLVVRVAEPAESAMVVLVTTEQGYNEMHHLAKHIQQAVPEVAVVAQNINSSAGNVIFGNKDRFLTKAHTLRAYIGKMSFSLSPRSFFQVNSGAAGLIYEKVREFAALKGNERVIDLYCGIGGISLFLADKAREVVGIEQVEAAVTDATENAAINGIKNCSFEAGDAARLLEEIGEEGGAQLIVLNPPRKGCDGKVLESAAALQPEKMIYVSCSPETLSRDLDILSRLGYRTLEVQPVDMFPQTVHVEDVALLVKDRPYERKDREA